MSYRIQIVTGSKHNMEEFWFQRCFRSYERLDGKKLQYIHFNSLHPPHLQNDVVYYDYIWMRIFNFALQGRGLILKYRSGRPLQGGKKGLYGLKLSEVSRKLLYSLKPLFSILEEITVNHRRRP